MLLFNGPGSLLQKDWARLLGHVAYQKVEASEDSEPLPTEMLWARRYFPEPEGTGTAAFHTQSTGWQSPRCPTSAFIPFPEDLGGKGEVDMPAKKVQHI